MLTMQTHISAEEFARFQSQLLKLRQEKYSSEEDRIRAENRTKSLEQSLAVQSGELAELRSNLSRIQRAGSIDALLKENESLRNRLINIESSFQLQTSTLKAECERMHSENAVLLATLKTAGLNHVDGPRQTQNSQTPIIPLTDHSSQTIKPGWSSASMQTDVVASDLANWQTQIHELLKVDALLQSERLVSKRLTQELDQHELDIERLERERDTLLNEVTIMEKRNDRVQRELKRQLAATTRAVKRLAEAPSLSSLVHVQQQPASQCDTISIGSFSLCGVVSSDSQGAISDGETPPESSAASPAPEHALFSEDDLKGLLNRLAEVQEDNCSLRRQMKHLEADLTAKSVIIQQRLAEKATSTHLPIQQPQRSSSNAVQVNSKWTSSSDVLSYLMTKLRRLEAAALDAPSCSISASAEVQGLKQLCEELMTRNMSLERALETALFPPTPCP